MSISDAQYQAWLERSGELRCALFRLTFAGNNGGALGEFHAYVSNMPYVTDGSETPANQIFDPCVLEIPTFTESIGEQLRGRSTQSYGDLIIANGRTLSGPNAGNPDYNAVLTSGPRDTWLRMNWDGRSIRQWLGDPSWAFSDFRLVLDGIIVDVFDAGSNKIGFRVSDKSALLSRQMITALLGGTGPQAGDLMPLCYGYLNPNIPSNVSPKLVDEANHVYKITGVTASSLIESIPSSNPFDVRENGISLTSELAGVTANAATDLLHSVGHGLVEHTRFQLIPSGGSTAPAPLVYGTDYWVPASGLTADDFKAAATRGGAAIDLTTAGSGSHHIVAYGWTTTPSTGTFQLAGNPLGAITCDPYGLQTGASPVDVLTAGGVANQVLTSSLTNTPLTSADIDATSLAAFIALCTSRLFVYLTDQIAFSDFLDKLVLSVGGWWGFNAAGKLVFGRMDLPVAGTPVYSFVAGDVASGSIKLLKRILPRAQIKIEGSTNHTVQTSVAGDVNEWNRAAFASGNAVSTGSATVTTWDTDPLNHKGAVYPDAFKTFLTDATEMNAEADRLATMFQYPTGIFGFDTHQAVYLLKRGDLIYVEHPTYTGYGIVTTIDRRVKGKSRLEFFCQLPDVYPTADIA